MIEGPEAFTRFESAMKKVLAVPSALLKHRLEEERKRSAAQTVRTRSVSILPATDEALVGQAPSNNLLHRHVEALSINDFLAVFM